MALDLVFATQYSGNEAVELQGGRKGFTMSDTRSEQHFQLLLSLFKQKMILTDINQSNSMAGLESLALFTCGHLQQVYCNHSGVVFFFPSDPGDEHFKLSIIIQLIFSPVHIANQAAGVNVDL